MCGRIIQASPPGGLALHIVDGRGERDRRDSASSYGNVPPRYNGAPSQDLWVIRQNAETGERTLDLLRWGLIPSVCDARPKPPPINARAETVATSRLFSRAYARRRCLVPVDGFYEWRMIEGQAVKQPFAIAMRDRTPFGLAGLWENWRDPASGEWVRTFCILTTRANDLVRTLHDRMPVIVAPADYGRWLGPERDPRDLLRPYPADAMEIWPVSPRVNSFRNEDASLVEPIRPGEAD